MITPWTGRVAAAPTYAVSLELLKVRLSLTVSKADFDAAVTLDQVVQLAIIPANQAAPEEIDWLGADWETEPGVVRDSGTTWKTTRHARILFGPSGDATRAAGSYKVLARVTDTPERPVFDVGTLNLK